MIIYFSTEHLNLVQIHSINYIQFIPSIMIYQHRNCTLYYRIKKGPTYISLLNGLLNLFHANHICINPKYITIDFEQAAILAIKLVFPNAIVKGCNFRFNKCIYGKLQDLGFQSPFINTKSDDPFEINIRNLYKKTCALAFMPPQTISEL